MNKKYRILVYSRNSEFLGYLKSVSYKKYNFTITKEVKNAKTFNTEDYVQGEIDTLTKMSFNKGYVFLYD